MTEKEVMVQRIKKLIKHAESAKKTGSVEEYESFMMKAIELTNKYNLTLGEINSTEEKEQDEFKNWGYSESISYHDKHQGSEWKKELMNIITTYNFTSYTYVHSLKRLQVYGRMENVDTTVWMYNFMSIGLYNLAQQKYKDVLAEKRARNKYEADMFSKVEAYKFKRDFLLGAIEGIDTKLSNQRREQFNAENAYAIIKINDTALNSFIEKKYPKIHEKKCTKKPKVILYGEGYEYGYEAGLNFNINKPLESRQPIKQLK